MHFARIRHVWRFLRNVRVSLHLNLTFIPKVIGSCSPIGMTIIIYPPPLFFEEHWCLHTVSNALQIYLHRTHGFRQGDQLFVSLAKAHIRKPVSCLPLVHTDPFGLSSREFLSKSCVRIPNLAHSVLSVGSSQCVASRLWGVTEDSCLLYRHV